VLQFRAHSYGPEEKIVTDQDLQDQQDELQAPAQKKKREPHPRLSPQNAWWRDFIEILLLIVTIYTLVNLATARAVVEGKSMEPSFYTGQLVIVNRFAYYSSAGRFHQTHCRATQRDSTDQGRPRLRKRHLARGTLYRAVLYGRL
jgi:hypothetical protein